MLLKATLLKKTDWFYTLPMAIGTYLGESSDEDSALYLDAITYALEHGVNFIDTALVYRGMRSEKDIGNVLNSLINEKKAIKREEIVISTKGGIIYGDAFSEEDPLDYLEKVLIPNGIIEKKDVNILEDTGHTLLPSFYEMSIKLSKKNLGIETIDIHYIHNPEFSKRVICEDLFYKQLEKLIEFYEHQVEIGNIKFYGMATWYAFISAPDSEWYISLEKVMDIVKRVAGENHHFKFVQMPYNKLNNLANTKTTQCIKGKYYTAIQAANELGLTVTISAPLNQCEEIIENKLSPNELLKYVTNTEGVYAAMVGSKRRKNLQSNMKIFLGE